VVEAIAKTRGSLRRVELSTLARDALESLPEALRREQLVFPGTRGAVLDLGRWRRGP
jgi:hypothetical protein